MMGEFSKMLTIIELEIRRIRHDYTDIAVRSLQPILWLLVFGTVFTANKVINTGKFSYLEFVAPGILAQSVLFISIFFGIMLVWDKDSGTLSKLLVSPISRFSIVLGKSLSAGVRGIAQALVVILLILAIGVHFYPNIGYTLLVFPVIVLISAVAASISILVASAVKTRERVMGIGQLLTMPLFFTSNALYPLEMMPWWLQWIARINPLTYGVDLLRALLLTGDLSQAPLDIAVLGGYLLLFTGLSAILLRRIME